MTPRLISPYCHGGRIHAHAPVRAGLASSTLARGQASSYAQALSSHVTPAADWPSCAARANMSRAPADAPRCARRHDSSATLRDGRPGCDAGCC